MPIYDYQCSACQFSDEVMRKVSASSAVEACPACGKEAFSKQLSAPSFQLNGTGWYATDFKNSGSKPKAKPKTESQPEASAEKTVTKSTDSGDNITAGSGGH